MKKWVRALAPVAIAGMLVALASCKGDTGPQGPAGSANCMHCHTDDALVGLDSAAALQYFLLPYETQFAVSRHALSDTYLRRGSEADPVCGRCHTTEGFQYYIATGELEFFGASSHISCFACHAPHTNEDFSLRKQGPTVEFMGANYDKEESNTCAVCHQARYPNPSIESDSVITSSRWGPHHGPQSNILAGSGAYVLPGVTYNNQAAHNIGISNGCVNCHMAALPLNNVAGGHSFAITYEGTSGEVVNSSGCTCHNWTDAQATTEVATLQAEFADSLSALGDMLLAKNWLNATKDAVTTNAKAPTTPQTRGIVYNYLMLLEDKSGSVHNPKYAMSVVRAAMAYLRGLEVAGL